MARWRFTKPSLPQSASSFARRNSDPKPLHDEVPLRERHAQLTAPIGTQSHFCLSELLL
jgi:hypothetical protein